ncbi:hypothetical protein QAD02_024438 [Eretmocerus hayati]|uniref:Uncharacterized protein n=1 Tax=Eretmocerus hayati TaxID=131215 RepID=A0ACC2PYQ8_9HYME|nr:hypothetical protein QAD02_024438 [Eretmocerus hayati]
MILEQDQQRGLAKENKSSVKVSVTSNVTTVERASNNLLIENSASGMGVIFSASESMSLDSTYEDADVEDLVKLPEKEAQGCLEQQAQSFWRGIIIVNRIQQGTFQRLVTVETQKNKKLAPDGIQNVMYNFTPQLCDAEVQKQYRPLTKHAHLLTLHPQISKASLAQANLAVGHCMFQEKVTPVLLAVVITRLEVLRRASTMR